MDKDIINSIYERRNKTAVFKTWEKLTENYHDKNPVVVGILRGAAPFMIDLDTTRIAIWKYFGGLQLL